MILHGVFAKEKAFSLTKGFLLKVSYN